MRFLVASFATIAMSLCSGCGNDMPETVRVTGNVTFDGQPPPGAGIVYFLPTEAAAGFPMRPATGDFGAEGAYRATTYTPNDGLMPGSYKIYIECWEQEPNMEGKPVKSYVPKKYQNLETSGFAIDIAPGTRSQEMDFDLVTK